MKLWKIANCTDKYFVYLKMHTIKTAFLAIGFFIYNTARNWI